jgi:hypothetical protein
MKPIHPVPPRELEDEELVARSRAGDVDAFAASLHATTR